jgi:hypothetical protein
LAIPTPETKIPGQEYQLPNPENAFPRWNGDTIDSIMTERMPRESNQSDRSANDLLKYQRFDEKEVTYRWHKDWWDGPRNGSISYRGQRFWFDFYWDTDEPGSPYYYFVYPLTTEEADFADSWSAENERFRSEWMPLGNDPARRDLPSTKEVEVRWKAHESRLPNYSDRQPLAWFISGTNASFYGVQVEKI